MPQRKPTVYILGAGASKAVALHAPLNDDLFIRALDFDGRPVSAGMLEIREFLHTFYPGFAQSEPQIPSLEDVLSQFDLAINEDRPISSTYTLAKLRELRDELVCAISEVLRRCLDRDDPADRIALKLLQDFVAQLQPEDTLVSLNYDIIIDNALLRDLRRWYNNPEAGGVDYGVSVRNGAEQVPEGVDGQKWAWKPYRSSDRLCPLYKPHGSLNWLYCPTCQRLDVTTWKSTRDLFSDASLICQACNGRYEALVITPTFFKSYANSVISETWRAVEEKLARADEIVFIGDSLPEADVHLRCMLTRALFRNRQRPTARHSQTPEVRVLEYDTLPPEQYYSGLPNPVHSRYQRIFGPVDFDPTGFVPYIERGCRTYRQTNAQAHVSPNPSVRHRG